MLKVRVIIFSILWTASFCNEQQDLSLLAISNQKLTANLFSNICKETGNRNFVFSPVSAEVILGLIAEGAAGNGREEIVPYLPPSRTSFEKYYRRLHNIENLLLYRSANRLFLRDDIKLNPNFEHAAASVYRTTVQRVDFRHPREAAAILNDWIHRQLWLTDSTNLSGPIQRSDIHRSTNMMFASTMQLTSSWETTFSLKNDLFYSIYSQTKYPAEVPFLSTTSAFGYYDDTELNAKFVEIPLKDIESLNGRMSKLLSLVLIVPDQPDGLEHILENMDKVFEPKPITNETLTVSFPKFMIQSDLSLNTVLENMGIKTVFNKTQANFSNLSFNKYSRYYVSKILSSASIDISEEGVEASSGILSGTPTRSLKIRVDANIPFMFYIQREGLILFAGRVATLNEEY